MDTLLKWIDWPIRVLMWAGLFFGFLMMAHVAVDVTGRVLFNHPFSGTTEVVSAYYMVAVAYMPLAWIAREDDHIVVELFTRNLSPVRLLILRTVMNLATGGYVFFLGWQTLGSALEEFHANEQWETASGFLPVWPSRFMVPMAGFLMGVFLFLVAFRDAAGLLRRRAEGRAP